MSEALPDIAGTPLVGRVDLGARVLCVGAEVATEPRPLTGYIRQRLKSLVQQLAERMGFEPTRPFWSLLP